MQNSDKDIHNRTSFDYVNEFQKAYPSKEDKERALKGMTNDQIDKLIKSSPNIQAKIFYAKFKKV